MTDEQKKEFTLKITQAGPAGLTILLYDITLEYLAEAEQAFRQQNRSDFRHKLHLAQNCIRMQQKSLQMQYEPAKTLHSLYIFLHSHLAGAITRFTIEQVQETGKILRNLRDAYQKAEQMEQEEPLMENTQKIYAGLTYGRHSLVENMEECSTGRGYLA